MALGSSFPKFLQSRYCGSQRAAGYTTRRTAAVPMADPPQQDPQHDGILPTSADPGDEPPDNTAWGGAKNKTAIALNKGNGSLGASLNP